MCWTSGSSGGQTPPERAGVPDPLCGRLSWSSGEGDARRVMDVLPKRFEKYGLTIHPEKTRLVRFQRPRPGTSRGGSPRHIRLPGVHPLLGPDARGGWVVKRKTAKDRFNRSLKSIAEWCRETATCRSRSMAGPDEQAAGALRVLRRDRQFARVSTFLYHVRRAWQKWLSRRSSKARILWERFGELERRFPLPPARLNRARLVT